MMTELKQIENGVLFSLLKRSLQNFFCVFLSFTRNTVELIIKMWVKQHDLNVK